MKFTQSDIRIFHAIISGGYTPYDLRQFVQFCHDLALPFIRKKIFLGKVNLSLVGMKEIDVVYDCLADLFQRDEEGHFLQIRNYFAKEMSSQGEYADEQYVITLRKLIASKVNQNIIRIYSEIDPALGKILRNMRLALDRISSFEEIVRFGEHYLIPRKADPLWHCMPAPFEFLEREIAESAMIHDTIPTLLTKLHTIIVNQNEYQRAISFVSTALHFKSVYTISWEQHDIVLADVEHALELDDMNNTIERVCNEVAREMYPKYVTRGKCSEEVFTYYIQAMKGILLQSSLSDCDEELTYFEHLRQKIDGLSKEEYLNVHRSYLEYLCRVTKEKLRAELT